MNQKKEYLLQRIKDGCLDGLETAVSSCMEQYPYDVDLYLLAGYLYLQQGNILQAEKLLLANAKHNYYCADTYYLLGDLFYAKGEFLLSMENYSIASSLSFSMKREPFFFSRERCDQKFDDAYAALEKNIAEHPENLKEAKEELDALSQRMDNSFFLFSDVIRRVETSLGSALHFLCGETRYCAHYHPITDIFAAMSQYHNLITDQGELLGITYQGQDLTFRPEAETLLPIASSRGESTLEITALPSGRQLQINQVFPRHFSYYRISEEVRITSENEFIVGEPVSLTQKDHLRKLVLSFFVDGLSWQLIREEGMENVMPYSHRFFSKGMCCENYFTSSDWTYPSLASFITGYAVPEHMMVHPDVNRPIPAGVDTLFRHMRQAGYYTAMFDSDYRTSPDYGYTRDIQRFVAQHPLYYNTKQVIPDVLEHIYAFQETSQYLWIGVPDLHDIADEYDMALGTAAHLKLADRYIGEKSATSVKQKYSPQKRKAYIRTLQAIDIQFAPLFQYLEDHYGEEEMIVTMFGDHGQTYLINPGNHPLERHHSNTAFLVRGGGLRGTSREYMSATDYSHILCRLAGAEPFQSPDGRLPKAFGGDRERDYTLTETIHPGDPYMAAIHAPSHTFYCTGEHPLTQECRLEQGPFHTILLDQSGLPMEDPGLTQKYCSLIHERLKYIYLY